jgi:hypothetical protein
MKNAFVLALVACMLMLSVSTFAVTATPTYTPSVVAVNPPTPPGPPIPPSPPPPPKHPGPIVCHVLPVVCE